MDRNMEILLFVAVTAVIVIIRYVCHRIADKTGDAIENAIKRKRNFETETKDENLADRYR